VKLIGVALTLVLLGSVTPAFGDVNDFEFESFDANYELSVNAKENQRSEMLVTETLVALFTNKDQNRGIRRDIPSRSYDSYPGQIQILSVTDENGINRDYIESRESNVVSLSIRPDDDSYVNGRQTYVIRYRQSWVIKNFQATSGFDEFYWDVNGTGWLQSFGRVRATVTFDDVLTENLVADAVSCYQGLEGSVEACNEAQVSADKMTFTANNLAEGENLTVAIGFNPNVVNTAGPQVEGTLSFKVFWAALGLIVLVLLWAIGFRIFGNKSQNGKEFVVPQYRPADNPGLLASALLTKETRHLVQALVVELAVKRAIEIEAVAGSERDFVLRRTQTASDSPLLTALGLLKSGDQILVGSSAESAASAELSAAVGSFIASGSAALVRDGYYVRRALGLPIAVFALSVVIYVIWFSSAGSLDEVTEAGFLFAPLMTFAPFALSYWFLLAKRPLSAKGSEVMAQVRGLEMYIELAEKDRLAFLQSPKGASLRPSQIESGKQVLKLYEEVLPWATLLGLEKEWSRVLSDLYQREGTPDRFIGSLPMAANLSNLSGAISASLTVSGSGGSSGGGSSGGGSGGGGGRGI